MAQNVRTDTYAPRPDVVVGYEERTSILPVRVRRISWGAIVAGIALALVTQIALQLLGLSIGVNTINPAQEAVAVDPSLRNAAVIWIAASTLISLFVGGWVAAYMAGIPDETDGVLHGLIVWAVVALLSLWLLTSSAMSLVSGITNTLGNVISATAQGVTSIAQNADDVAPEVSRVVQDIAPGLGESLGIETTALQDIENEVSSFMSQTTQPATTTGDAETEEGAATTSAQTGTQQQDSAQASQEISGAVLRLATMEEVPEVDRQEVVQLIASRTNMTEAEAQEALTRWETSIRDARVQVEQSVEEAAQRLTDAISALAGILFVGMLIGAFAAGVGGYVGTPERRDVELEAMPPAAAS